MNKDNNISSVREMRELERSGKNNNSFRPRRTSEVLRRETVGFCSRGQNPLLSHTIAIGFSLFLIVLVITTLNSLRDNYQDFIGKNEISQVCSILKGSVEKIYVDDGYTSPVNTTKGRIVAALPQRIADLNYRVRLINNSFFVETSGPRINATCRIGFNLTYNGSTNGGMTELIYTEKDNGQKWVSVTKI